MQRQPNILFITADQLRSDCVGYSGKYPVQTPNLDQLAARSTVFHHAYSHFPVCSPARQSLLHGKRPETFGALWNYNSFLPVGYLQPDQYTWTKQLADAGYRSAFLGKWGVNPEFGPTAFGYESYVSEGDYRAFRQSRYPDLTYTNGFFGENNPVALADSETHWYADRAIETIETLSQGDRPWHIALHFAEPHLPCRPSEPFAEMYDPAQVPEWDGFRDNFASKPYIQAQQLASWGVESFTWEDWAPIVARYYGIISQLDDAIGRVLAALARLGQADNTIIVFTADHGDMCGSHGMMDKHYILYDDVIRVPLIISFPGESSQAVGLEREQLVYNLLDLGPTLLDLAGLDYSADSFHGKSLAPLLLAANAPSDADWRDQIVATYNGQQFGLYTQRMIRTKEWKYVWNLTDIDELYDMQHDHAELCNVISLPEHQERIAELRTRLYEQLKKEEDPVISNEWTRRQLLNGAKRNQRA
ncbi:sulfatase-like hydrolase/transferase [Paenibacillus sp. OV219]|uniref:sulfatase-like hydrolase/transferase n=1 Tax=Paenibacillus sp. OV219 TaxID=1884377 RepID=UPI0008C6ED50|nr:sulfatase-like hydrolase/transferase [Paenibacillus sp. OV219]SEM89747.1 Arylsulfatase A [Paenibacillus sp. OV219]